MPFRRPKSQAHRKVREWLDWIGRYRVTLQALGLPPEVYLDAGHWQDFLENGCLDRHIQDSTGFTFDQLSRAAAGALRRFLEEIYGQSELCPPLLGWLRVRHDEGQID